MPALPLSVRFILVFLGLMTFGVLLKTGLYAAFGAGWLGFLMATAIAGAITAALAWPFLSPAFFSLFYPILMLNIFYFLSLFYLFLLIYFLFY